MFRKGESNALWTPRATIEGLLPKLSAATHGAICDWAEVAAGIKGFGPLKARNVVKVRARWQEIAAGL
jgi:indolepyruvate ferredoxin oxidoreductase